MIEKEMAKLEKPDHRPVQILPVAELGESSLVFVQLDGVDCLRHVAAPFFVSCLDRQDQRGCECNSRTGDGNIMIRNEIEMGEGRGSIRRCSEWKGRAVGMASMTIEALEEGVHDGTVDTVVVAMVDIQGRLQGKRLDAHFFLDETLEHGTEGCNYLLRSTSR